MGGGMSGEPLRGVNVRVGNRASSHVTPWVTREGGHRLVTGLIGEPRGGPRGQTASRNTHSGRAPSLNWCGLGPSRGPFRDDTQEYVILPVLSLTSVSSKWLSHSDPVSQPGRQVGAHPILQSPFNSCQRSVTSTEVGGLYNFDTLFIWLFFILKFTTPMTQPTILPDTVYI